MDIEFIKTVLLHPNIAVLLTMLYVFSLSVKKVKELSEEVTRVSHIVVGVDGKNGLRSRVCKMEEKEHQMEDFMHKIDTDLSIIKEKLK